MNTRCLLVALVAVALSACAAPPTGLVVAIRPASPTTVDALVAVVVDLPAGDVEVAWSWSRDGVAQPELDELDTVPASLTAVGETWRVVGLPIAASVIGDPAEATVEVQDHLTVQGIDLISLPAGTFAMGCTDGEDNCTAIESPVHTVTLSNPFWLGETEVTQRQWEDHMGTTPSYFGPAGGGSSCGDDCPVELVNWFEAAAFANAVSEAEGLPACYALAGCTGTLGGGCDGGPDCSTDVYRCSEPVTVTSATGSVYDCDGFRLPTEAEWEYSARAGEDFLFSGSNTVEQVAWYDLNSDSTTHVVADKEPNGWGLFDMSGNVWEWTGDWYALYSAASVTDPAGPEVGSDRVLRGGSWTANDSFAQLALRASDVPGMRNRTLGFRLAKTLR